MRTLNCPTCHREYSILDNVWLCPCGSALEVQHDLKFDPGNLDAKVTGLWRYSSMLPVSRESIVTLGEGWTPLVDFLPGKPNVRLKMESLNPTGSYKDRGVSVMISAIAEAGVREVVEDSSGNAGASVAAYARRAGMDCHIYVPASHSGGKMKQIQAYGADLVAVPGSRDDTTRAAHTAARELFYASHAYSPFFVEGLKTLAYELWEQCEGKLPEVVVSPLGQGSILLGLFKGFGDLVAGGWASHMPRFVGVQAEACDPVVRAFEQGLDSPVPVETAGATLAEGIKITNPVRGKMILRAIRESGGAAVAVSEDEIARAKTDLAHQGVYVEATSAVTLAGLRKLEETGVSGGSSILILTGSGLKTT